MVNYPRKWAYFTPIPSLGLAKAYPARDIYRVGARGLGF